MYQHVITCYIMLYRMIIYIYIYIYTHLIRRLLELGERAGVVLERVALYCTILYYTIRYDTTIRHCNII